MPWSSFPCFLEKGRENPQETVIFILAEPLKSLEKKGKSPPQKGIPWKAKSKEKLKSKEKKIRVDAIWKTGGGG